MKTANAKARSIEAAFEELFDLDPEMKDLPPIGRSDRQIISRRDAMTRIGRMIERQARLERIDSAE